MTNSSSSANLRRTSSVDNLSSRPNLLAKYTQQSSPSRDRPRYERDRDSGRGGGGAALPPRDAGYSDRYAEPASRLVYLCLTLMSKPLLMFVSTNN